MHQVCRTCFQKASERNYIELEDDPQSLDIKNKLQFCIPELDLTLTVKPVVCILCVNLLNSTFTFKKQCLETEHSIKRFLFGLEEFKSSIQLEEIYKYKNNETQNIQVEDNTETVVHIESVRGSVENDDLNNLLDEVLDENVSVTIVEQEIVKIELDDDDDDDVILLEEENLLVEKDSGDELQVEDHSDPSECEIHDEDHNVHTEDQVVKKHEGKGGRRSTNRKTVQVSPDKDRDPKGPLPCVYCDFSSLKFEVLLAHISCHRDILKSVGKPYFCPLCKLRSRWKFSIINHMKMHNINVEKRDGHGRKKRAKCKKCPFVTRSSTKWQTILDEHNCVSPHTRVRSSKRKLS